MERPRKIGAKFTNANIAPDEFAQPELCVDYDGKRDRYIILYLIINFFCYSHSKLNACCILKMIAIFC